MRSPESFDAFYAETRDRLLHESYALTGDLAASRLAVRDAFTVAWHHWRKVSKLEEREGYVRHLAHRSAQRRQVARPWHRDKGIDDEVRATLDALAKLTAAERKTLVLTTLSPMSLADISREVGLPRSDAERALQSATSRFALARDVASTDVLRLLQDLLRPIAETRWPRSTIVRRAGTARRRTHTLAGAAGAVAALVVSGTIVASDGVAPSSLGQESVLPKVEVRAPAEPDAASLDDTSLLAEDQVKRFDPGLKWRETDTSDNLAGDGLSLPCQQTRFADPDSTDALMRSFTGTTRPKREAKADKKSNNRPSPASVSAVAVEYVEMSADAKAARTTFATVRGWYAECLDSRAQLLSTHEVSRVGDEAHVLTLRTWNKTPAAISVGLARSGELTLVTLVRSTGKPVPVDATATGLAAAVNAACGKTGAGTCAGPPKVRPSAPFAVGKPPGLLSTVDLPPVVGAVGPWVGTDPIRARSNFASTRCDNTQFNDPALKQAFTRTFVFPDKVRVPTFGLTQTVASMPPKRAVDFVAEVRSRIRTCGGANLGTSVDTLVSRSTKSGDLTVWVLGIEISDEKTLQFWMAIMRDSNAVSQIGFTPAEGMTMSRDAFAQVADRALERLSDLPGS